MADEDDYNDDIHDIPSSWGYCKARVERAKEDRGISPNQTYLSTYHNFIDWFDQKRFAMVELGEVDIDLQHPLETYESTEGTVHITQYNVDMYFSTYLVHHPTGNKATTKRKVSALTWFLVNVEDRDAVPLEISVAIHRALADHHAVYLDHQKRNHAGTDPHKGLKDPLSDEEISRLYSSIWNLRRDSLDLLFAFSWGLNAGVRGGSSRKIFLCDLNLSYGFGPEDMPPLNKTLLIVLRKGERNKDRFTTDKQVGVQRHLDYRKCSVFITAALVILKLRKLGARIHFRRGNANEPAEWWGYPLNAYTTYSQESSDMITALTDADLLDRYAKVTHHRTMMVQIAGSRGLTPYQVSTMTKHLMDKIYSAYQPEVEQETLKVMSGFKKHEARYVPTEHAQLPGNHNEYLRIGLRRLLPHYDRYLLEYHSVDGDKSTCCKKFLLHILPYFAETVLQSGFWFIHDFPNHPMTQILRVSFLLISLLLFCTIIMTSIMLFPFR